MIDSIFLLTRSANIRANIALLAISVVLPLYAIEIYIDSIEQSTGNNDLVGKFAKLNGAFFNESNLTGADLNGTDLRRANLSKINLSETNLIYVNLSEADLSEANLSGA